LSVVVSLSVMVANWAVNRLSVNYNRSTETIIDYKMPESVIEIYSVYRPTREVTLIARFPGLLS